MKNHRKTHLRTARLGMTLVEVVVGLLLLSTLLVGLLTAFGQHAKQIRRSRIRMEAICATDQLMAEWFSESGRLPYEDQGEVEGHEEFTWQITPKESLLDESLDIGTVRFELFYRNPAGSGNAKDDEVLTDGPLVSLDLIVPALGKKVGQHDAI